MSEGWKVGIIVAVIVTWLVIALAASTLLREHRKRKQW
jgi:hypothetical protein